MVAEAEAWVMIPKLDTKKEECVLDMHPLVLRKDCKQSGMDSASYPHYWCSAHSEYHDGDWFCADGEKKEGDKHED
jgi:hypothetical protein